jgi:hypothetical protein
MNREYSYYEILDLDEQATPQQVRTAYLRLMKQHHPDRSSGEQTPGFVALINLCYETLSNPAKRAAYDAELRQRNNAAIALSSKPVLHPRQARSRNRPRTPWVVAAGCLAVVIALISLNTLSLSETPAVFQWQGTVAPEPAKLPRLTQRDLIQRQVRLAKMLSPAEALLFSERCFQRAQTEDSGKALQLCIVFDDAFLYWRQTPQWNATLPAYFDDEVVHARHTNSLLRFEANTEGTLARLRYEAFRALLDDVDKPVVQAGEPA